MNKKLISLAVAAAVTAPAAALADATLYGKTHVSIDWFEIKGSSPREEYKGWALNKGQIGKGNDRSNRLGVKGSEDLGGGLKAIYQVEFDIPLVNERDYDIDNGEQGGFKMRNSFVGLEGDFGTFLVGRHDTPLKISTSKLEMFDDTMADYEGTIGFDDIRADNTIAYITPSFSGFQFAAATIPGAASTLDGSENRNSDSLAEGYSLAAIYGNGPWHASAAYEVITDQFGNQVQAATFDTTDYKKWRVGLGVQDLNGFYLSAIYEKQQAFNFREKADSGKDNDADVWQGQIGYAFGNSMVKGMYGKNKPDATNETKSWAIGVDHNFSKRTKAYALYTQVDVDKKGSDEGDWNGFSVGMIHSF